MIKNREILGWLVPVVGLLSLVAAVAGLGMTGGSGPHTFTTVHGQTVELFGQGLYGNDTVFFAATFKGIDAVTLAVFIPALAAAWWWHRRGSQRGALLLTAVLSIFLYNGASMAFGAAYNSLFLVYVALLAASFFAFALALTGLDHRQLAAEMSPRLPRRGLAIFLFLAGLAPLVLWLSDIVGPLAAGRVPELLGSYTIPYTYAVDLALIVPTVYCAGYLLLRRTPVAYALTATVLILLASVGIGVIAATIVQSSVGIVFGTGQFIGLIGSWVVLGAFAIGFVVVLLRSLPNQPGGHQRSHSGRRARAAKRPEAASAGR